MGWIIAACGSAIFGGLVSVLGKAGLRTTDSDVATALRTVVVLLLAWGIAFAQGSLAQLGQLSPQTWLFLILSGLTAGSSWLCSFKALSLGDVNKVIPIDKSSAVLASLFAIVLFSERDNLAVKLVCIAVILVGTLMMVQRSDSNRVTNGWCWLLYAMGAAVFAALTSILGKMGIDGVDSNLGTAIRTVVVLAMAWGIVAGKGKLPEVVEVNRREAAYLVLSGLATGASWLCFYYALQVGVVSVVVQIDKLSLLVSVAFAAVFFRERLTSRAAIGLALLTAGTAVMALYA